MYTPFSTGKAFGNQETKIILCAFSHLIYSSPIQDLFAVSFGMKAEKHPMQLLFPRIKRVSFQRNCGAASVGEYRR